MLRRRWHKHPPQRPSKPPCHNKANWLKELEWKYVGKKRLRWAAVHFRPVSLEAGWRTILAWENSARGLCVKFLTCLFYIFEIWYCPYFWSMLKLLYHLHAVPILWFLLLRQWQNNCEGGSVLEATSGRCFCQEKLYRKGIPGLKWLRILA